MNQDGLGAGNPETTRADIGNENDGLDKALSVPVPAVLSTEDYDDGDCAFYYGGCLGKLPVLADSSVDFVLTDLPYGKLPHVWDRPIPFRPLWQQLLRVAKPTAAFAFTAAQPFTTKLVSSMPDLFRYDYVWVKSKATNFINAHDQPLREHESVLVFYRHQPTYNPQMMQRSPGGSERMRRAFTATRNSSHLPEIKGQNNLAAIEDPQLRLPGSILYFASETGLHPTQKPVPLMEFLVRTYTNEADVVLDVCMGSGTTGVAAVKARRRFVGMELMSDWYAGSVDRVLSARCQHQQTSFIDGLQLVNGSEVQYKIAD